MSAINGSYQAETKAESETNAKAKNSQTGTQCNTNTDINESTNGSERESYFADYLAEMKFRAYDDPVSIRLKNNRWKRDKSVMKHLGFTTDTMYCDKSHSRLCDDYVEAVRKLYHSEFMEYVKNQVYYHYETDPLYQTAIEEVKKYESEKNKSDWVIRANYFKNNELFWCEETAQKANISYSAMSIEIANTPYPYEYSFREYLPNDIKGYLATVKDLGENQRPLNMMFHFNRRGERSPLYFGYYRTNARTTCECQLVSMFIAERENVYDQFYKNEYAKFRYNEKLKAFVELSHKEKLKRVRSMELARRKKVLSQAEYKQQLAEDLNRKTDTEEMCIQRYSEYLKESLKINGNNKQ
jgi:hypothetical protein